MKESREEVQRVAVLYRMHALAKFFGPYTHHVSSHDFEWDQLRPFERC
jgi:hypothetical protein